MKIKQLIALFLALALLCSVFVGCSGSSSDDNESGESADGNEHTNGDDEKPDDSQAEDDAKDDDASDEDDKTSDGGSSSDTDNTDSSDNNSGNKDIYYTVSTQAEDLYGTAGTYTKLDQKQIALGENVTLTATPNSGYSFEGWYLIDGTGFFASQLLVSEEPVYSFTMTEKQSDVIFYKAVFTYHTVSTYSDTDEYGVAGTYTEFNEKKISVGDTVTLTATVNDGYNFEGWFRGDICLSKDLTYTFIMPKESIELRAEYSAYTFATNSDSDEYGIAGTYTKYDNEKISVGQKITLTATVNDGYNFEGWFRDGICLSKELTYTLTMPSESLEIWAVYSYYEVNTYSYDSDNYGGAPGTYTKLDHKKVSVGETVTITASANPGYRFTGWYFYFGVDAACVCASPTYTFVMERGNVDLCAGFEPIS